MACRVLVLILVPELFERAREHVLIAGYSIDEGRALFEPLHARMRDGGVTIDLFVGVHPLEERLEHAAGKQKLDWAALSAPMRATGDPTARGRAVVALFPRMMWPFGEPRPAVHFDPRTAERYSGVSMHAKCVVIDHEYTPITSANFTSRRQTRSVEAGGGDRGPGVRGDARAAIGELGRCRRRDEGVKPSGGRGHEVAARSFRGSSDGGQQDARMYGHRGQTRVS